MLKAYTRARAYINSLRSEEDGATAVEYGLLVALIAAAIIAAVLALGGTLNGVFEGVNSKLGPVTPE